MLYFYKQRPAMSKFRTLEDGIGKFYGTVFSPYESTKSSSWTKNGTIISAVLVVAVIAVSAAFALGSFLWRGRLSS
ncbi:hypothetical protein RRG08_049147 [Elysia crispata]|uniref:Uncharacterized protein n=1 Tax=Elysia crispata TaxID=231223 RepID=A0AAE0YLG0_9GAST|nr:hypothetical protein RRG08_049147 [Elysia crispata]